MDEVRWGILGAGKISYRFAAALEQVENARLVAVSGRNAARLDEFASVHPVDEAHRYASAEDDGFAAHERLVSDPEADAVYLALPHGLHEAWACRALRAGKAVLCEKPAVLREGEAERIRQVARETGGLFVEAMKPRFTPVRDQIHGLLAGGDLGGVVGVEVTHRLHYGSDLGGYLLDPIQGGTLYDLGCYGLSWVEDILEGDVEVERVDVRWMDGASGVPVDIADDVRMRVGGIPVHVDLAGDAPERTVTLRIQCEHGAIEVPTFHRPSSLAVTCGESGPKTVELPLPVDDFYGEVAHVCELVRAGGTESPVMPLDATVRVAHLIDAIRAAWPARANG